MNTTPAGDADEHAKRPDREQIAKALHDKHIEKYPDEPGSPIATAGPGQPVWRHLADAVLALEPEAREVTDTQVKAAQAEIAKLAPYNVELRPDGSEDRETAAYVAGIDAAHGAMRAVLEAAAAVV